MSLSLQILSHELGKNQKTLARWCEAGIVPGAYRLAGGDVRRGKWRVRFPRISKQDAARARARAKRAGLKVSEYAALCAFDRLLGRIMINAKPVARRRLSRAGEASAHAHRNMLLAELESDCRGKIWAVNHMKVLQKMADLAHMRAMTHTPEGNLYGEAIAELGSQALMPLPVPVGTARANRLSPALQKLAYSKARLMQQTGRKPRAATVSGLCRAMGLPMSWVRRDAQLARMLRKQVAEANFDEGVGVKSDVLTAPAAKPKKTGPRRDFTAKQKEMYRDAARTAKDWLATMSAQDRAALEPETLAHLQNLAAKASAGN